VEPSTGKPHISTAGVGTGGGAGDFRDRDPSAKNCGVANGLTLSSLTLQTVERAAKKGTHPKRVSSGTTRMWSIPIRCTTEKGSCHRKRSISNKSLEKDPRKNLRRQKGRLGFHLPRHLCYDQHRIVTANPLHRRARKSPTSIDPPREPINSVGCVN